EKQIPTKTVKSILLSCLNTCVPGSSEWRGAILIMNRHPCSLVTQTCSHVASTCSNKSMVPVKLHVFPALVLTIIAVLLAACSTVEKSHQETSSSHVASMVDRSTPPEAKVLDADPDGCTWVAATGSVRFGDQDTKHQAFAQAIAEARRKAMGALLGVRIDH